MGSPHDGQNIEDQHQDEIGVNHNHQEDSDDSCPDIFDFLDLKKNHGKEEMRARDLFYARIYEL